MARTHGEDTGAPLLFGVFLVSEGYVRQAQVDVALRAQMDLAGTHACTALRLGLISADELRACHEAQSERGLSAGEALEALGILPRAQVHAVDVEMETAQLRIGEILVRRGALTSDQLRETLQRHAATGGL